MQEITRTEILSLKGYISGSEEGVDFILLPDFPSERQDPQKSFLEILRARVNLSMFIRSVQPYLQGILVLNLSQLGTRVYEYWKHSPVLSSSLSPRAWASFEVYSLLPG
jgi:hypothetical protein